MSDKKLIGITQPELEQQLAEFFEYNRGKGYFYCDANYDDPDLHQNIYDRLLSRFDNDQRRMIEDQVEFQMSKPGVHRIMDQGCGHANTLRKTTYARCSPRLSSKHKRRYFSENAAKK